MSSMSSSLGKGAVVSSGHMGSSGKGSGQREDISQTREGVGCPHLGKVVRGQCPCQQLEGKKSWGCPLLLPSGPLDTGNKKAQQPTLQLQAGRRLPCSPLIRRRQKVQVVLAHVHMAGRACQGSFTGPWGQQVKEV